MDDAFTTTTFVFGIFFSRWINIDFAAIRLIVFRSFNIKPEDRMPNIHKERLYQEAASAKFSLCSVCCSLVLGDHQQLAHSHVHEMKIESWNAQICAQSLRARVRSSSAFCCSVAFSWTVSALGISMAVCFVSSSDLFVSTTVIIGSSRQPLTVSPSRLPLSRASSQPSPCPE